MKINNSIPSAQESPPARGHLGNEVTSVTSRNLPSATHAGLGVPRAEVAGRSLEGACHRLEGAIILPCRGRHASQPYSADTVTLCAKIASLAAKMPLDVAPPVCLPTASQFGRALARDAHASTEAAYDTSRKSGYLALSEMGLFKGSAAYLFSRHQIIINPLVKKVLTALGDDWSDKILLVHEMTHAAQAQKYPQLFEQQAKGETNS